MNKMEMITPAIHHHPHTSALVGVAANKVDKTNQTVHVNRRAAQRRKRCFLNEGFLGQKKPFMLFIALFFHSIVPPGIR